MMHLAENKCSVSLFSMNVKDASMSALCVLLNEVEIKRKRNPCFLGITYDNRPIFRSHFDKVCKKGHVRMNVLRHLSRCDWGWNKI